MEIPLINHWQLQDGFDESDCGDPAVLAQEQTLRFRLSRFNRYSDFYDIGDGEWGWFDENIDEDREQFIVRDIPLTTDRWYFNVFRCVTRLEILKMP